MIASPYSKISPKDIEDLRLPALEKLMQGLPQGVPDGRIPVFYSGDLLAQFFWGNQFGEAAPQKTQGEAFTPNQHHSARPLTRPDYFATIDQSAPGELLAALKGQLKLPGEVVDGLNREASRLYAVSASGPVICCVLGAGARSAYSWANDPNVVSALERAGAKSEEINSLASRGSVPRVFDKTAAQIYSLKDSEKEREALENRLENFDPKRSIWLEVELPALLRNEKVTHLNGIPLQKLLDHWLRDSESEQALFWISRAIGDGIFDGPPKTPSLPPVPNGGTIVYRPEEIYRTAKLKPSFEVRISEYKSTAELFKEHRILPGGVVFSPNLKTNIDVRTIRFDAKQEGRIVVNGNLALETGLSREELSLLVESFSHPAALGAHSIHFAAGTKPQSRLGTLLRLADRMFADFVFNGAELGNFEQYLTSIPQPALAKRLEQLEVEPIFGALEEIFSGRKYSIALELASVAFQKNGDQLTAAQVRVNLHASVMEGNANQPKFIGGIDAFRTTLPDSFAQLERLTKNPDSTIGSGDLFRKVAEYAAVYALIRAQIDRGQRGKQPYGAKQLVLSKLQYQLRKATPRAIIEEDIDYRAWRVEHVSSAFGSAFNNLFRAAVTTHSGDEFAKISLFVLSEVGRHHVGENYRN